MQHQKNIFPLVPRRGLFLPQGETYAFDCGASFQMLYLHFYSTSLAGRDLLSGDARKAEPSFIVLDRVLANLLQKLPASSDLGDLFEWKGLLYQIAGRILRSQKSQATQKIFMAAEKYRVFFEWAKNRRFDEIKLASFLKLAGWKAANFSNQFHRDTGLSPRQFLHRAILERSRDQLLTTEKKIRELAEELGFQDEFYFSRFFKKTFRVSPGEYRKENRFVAGFDPLSSDRHS
ncbi:MAG: helix-turn-helix transcriptional regulator [Spirochaetia bacterium]|nr:helix-turn-helix transcriptional regulator [Spirochaetia bacterium]